MTIASTEYRSITALAAAAVTILQTVVAHGLSGPVRDLRRSGVGHKDADFATSK